MKVFVAPHNDDEGIFGALTLLREKPTVVVVYDSFVQPGRGLPNCDAATRWRETVRACRELGCEDVRFLGFRDDTVVHPGEIAAALIKCLHAPPQAVWAPAFEADGHVQHNIVSEACDLAGLPVVDRYMTYTFTSGKSFSSKPVPIQDGSWIGKKLRALACYESQFNLDPRMQCWPHFIDRSLREYYA